MEFFSFCAKLTWTILFVCPSINTAWGYRLGVGKADITGPATDVNLMGYAMLQQTARGLHTRQYARAFIVVDDDNPVKRIAYVNIDACMASQLVTMTVLEQLKPLYGSMYTEDNLAISGTHTHAASAGFLQYVLYDITSLGFVQQTFDALVKGIVKSVVAAHTSLAPSKLYLNWGELLDANINRSPSAYLNNPQEERELYEHDVDKEMVIMKGVDEQGRSTGLLSWFSVHCTSMNNTNRLLSADNKGVAEQIAEAWGTEAVRRRKGSPAADGAWDQPMAPGFIAAFAQGSVGDTSPNTQGAFCLDSGLPCEPLHSTCHNRTEMCHGRGPGWPDDRLSTWIIGEKQATKAKELFDSAQVELSGPVDYRHVFLDMTNITVVSSRVDPGGRTCPAAMGYSFAAGTTDGPGAFDFTQADVHGSSFWNLVRHLIHEPSKEQKECHAPKPILLDTGEMGTPYPWQPSVTEISVLRVGQLVIVCVPGEFTTMAGRRMKRAVQDRVRNSWGEVKVVLSGLTNTYSSYITTYEEYQIQRYEGASTLYGPHTLGAYVQETLKLVDAMLQGAEVQSSVRPPNLRSRQISLLPPVVEDQVPRGAYFGQVVQDVEPLYHPGEQVNVTFRSGCLRNNLRTEDTFLVVERLHPTEHRWYSVADDNDWSTRLEWWRDWAFSTHSFVSVIWDIPEDAADGNYRIRHFGDYKPLLGVVRPYEGASSDFTVVRERFAKQGRGRGLGFSVRHMANILARVWQIFVWRGC